MRGQGLHIIILKILMIKLFRILRNFISFLQKKTGFLSQFSKQNLFKIFNRATRIQNKAFLNSPKALLKEDYYEKLGKSILTDYYIQKYSGNIESVITVKLFIHC